MKCVGPDLRLTGVATIAALPAVTRNCLAEGRWELSVKLMSLYYENLLRILTSTYRSHDLLRRRAVLRYSIWMTFENIFPFFRIVIRGNLNFLILVVIPSLYDILLYWQGRQSYPGCGTDIYVCLIALRKSAMSLIYEIFSAVELQGHLGV
jgi:hypothetical protein